MTHHAPGDGHHPGPPRFLQVGDRLVDPIFVDTAHGFDRDNLAPSITGTPDRDPDGYDRNEFTWRLAGKPSESSASVAYAPTPYDDVRRYDHGLHNTAEFQPDVPGEYVFELDDGERTYEQTVRVFPAEPVDDPFADEDNDGVGSPGTERDGGVPRLALEGRYDAATDCFVVESNAELAPDSAATPDDLQVAFQPHDAATLDAADVTVEDGVARVPRDAVAEPTSLYAAPFDGRRLGVTDEVVLDADEEHVEHPNRPPDWLDDAVVYEIFTRSFAGEPGETDFEFLADNVDYLGDLGVDVVWLTPIVPAWSADLDTPPGGPHGYSTGDYFDVADDLGTLEEYEAFVDACHDHDIRVCFDLVVNHCGWTNDVFQDTVADLGPEPDGIRDLPAVTEWDTESQYFDWFDRRADASETDAAPAQTSFFGVRFQPNLNFGNLALREYVLAAVDFWSDRVDMFRCDIAWGVPHSFWKEARALTREKDAEFAWLNESIPRHPAFSASEFDVHFDTTGFMESAHAVARGERPPSDLLDAIDDRGNDGFPRYTRVLNTTENHDESRIYNEATESGVRDDPASAQRAAVAAAFTLPGVPFLYYGQERLISEYGTRRESPFSEDEDATCDVQRDPYKRGFMNWDDSPDDHLAFYRDLVSFYHDSPVLGPESDLVRAAHRTDAGDDVLVFGRDAGDEKRVVVVNFADEPRRVDLRPVVDSEDLVTGEDVAVERTDDALSVAVDTLAVLATPTLFDQGR